MPVGIVEIDAMPIQVKSADRKLRIIVGVLKW